MKDVPILCPSKGRAGHVSTLNMISNVKLIVPEKEKESYQESHPDTEVIATPRQVNNISKTRQWILNQWPDNFQVDDDIYKIVRNYYEDVNFRTVNNPDEAYQIIQGSAYLAKQFNAKMWGFGALKRPNQYDPNRPFRFTGLLYGSFVGFFKGHNLYYPEDLLKAEDYFISCLNIYKNRYMFIDTRFTFHTKDNFEAVGGCNDTRTTEIMAKNTIELKKLFGDAIQLKKPSNIRKKVNWGERSLKLPY